MFIQVRYQGVSVTLVPGRRYTSLDAMGLGSPVKSMRRFSGNNADVSTEAVAQRSMKLCDICRRYTLHWCSVLCTKLNTMQIKHLPHIGCHVVSLQGDSIIQQTQRNK